MKPCKPATRTALFPANLDQLFQDFWGETTSPTEFAPRVDVTETDDAYVLSVDLPGLEPEDVELTVTPEGLVLKGERPSEDRPDGERAHISERVHGRFSRTFKFPVAVKPDDVVAESKRGVLRIEVKKVVAEQSRRIQIRGD